MKLEKEQFQALCDQLLKEVAKCIARRKIEDPVTTVKEVKYNLGLVEMVIENNTTKGRKKACKRPLKTKPKRKYTKKVKSVEPKSVPVENPVSSVVSLA